MCRVSVAIFSVCTFSIIISVSSTIAPQQDVIDPQCSVINASTSIGRAHASYQMHRRPFGSNSGSGHTVWYTSRSDSSIQSPPVIPQSEPGHLYVHFDTSTKTHQYWMLVGTGQWESVAKGAEYPHNHGRVLSFRSNGEPSWVLRATIGTTDIRRARGRQEETIL